MMMRNLPVASVLLFAVIADRTTITKANYMFASVSGFSDEDKAAASHSTVTLLPASSLSKSPSFSSNSRSFISIDCADNGMPVQVQIDVTTDLSPLETTWALFDGVTSEIIINGGPYVNEYALETEILSVCSSKCLKFVIYDSYGDGLTDCGGKSPGSYKIVYNNDVIHEGSGDFESEDSSDLFGIGCPTTAPSSLSTSSKSPSSSSKSPSSSSKSPSFLSKSPSSSSNSPSISSDSPSVSSNSPSFSSNTPTFSSNTPSFSSNNPSLSSNSPSLVSIDCVDNGMPVQIQIDVTTDLSPLETTWALFDDITSEIIVNGGPYVNPYALETNIYSVCSSKCLKFVIYDSYGDGLTDCGDESPGSYKIVYNNDVVHEGSGDFESEDSSDLFGIGCPTTAPSSSSTSSKSPSYSSKSPSSSSKSPSFLSKSPSSSSNSPSISSDSPSVSSNTPSVSSNTPTFSSNMPSFSSNTPSFSSNNPSFSSNSPSLSSNSPSLISIDCVDNGMPVQIQIDITTDLSPLETTWALFDGVTSEIIVNGGPYVNPYALETEILSVCSSKCLKFVIYDSYGDGLTDCGDESPGSYKIVYNNDVIHEGSGDFKSEDSSDLFGIGCPTTAPSSSSISSKSPSSSSKSPSSSSKSPTFLSKSPSSSSNSPSVSSNTPSVSSNTPTFSSNMPSFSSNTPSFSSNNPSFSSNSPSLSSNSPSLISIDCVDNGIPIQIQIDVTLDRYPEETTWALLDGVTSEIIVKGGPYINEYANETNIYSVCPNKCLKFVIYDSFNDGLNDGGGGSPGSYQVIYNNDLIHEGSGNFESVDSSNPFGIGCLPSSSNSPSFSSNLTSPPSTYCDDKGIPIPFRIDINANSVSWELINVLTNETVVEGGPYLNANVSVTHTETHSTCPSDCLKFTIKNSLSASSRDGIYKVFYNNSHGQETDVFGSEESHIFGVGCPTTKPPTLFASSSTPTSVPSSDQTLAPTISPSSNALTTPISTRSTSSAPSLPFCTTSVICTTILTYLCLL